MSPQKHPSPKRLKTFWHEGKGELLLEIEKPPKRLPWLTLALAASCLAGSAWLFLSSKAEAKREILLKKISRGFTT